MAKRRNKTAQQQCKHYKTDHIFEYMVSKFQNGYTEEYQELFRELGKTAKHDFVEFVFYEVGRERVELIQAII